MAQTNDETIRAIYRMLKEVGSSELFALPQGDRRAIFERVFHPELEIRQSPEIVLDTAGTFHGFEGFDRAGHELLEALGEIEFEAGESLQSGDVVVFEIRATAMGIGSGVPVELQMAHEWEIEDGLARRWVVHPTLERALTAAGLAR
jgi:hypothetical protein